MRQFRKLQKQDLTETLLSCSSSSSSSEEHEQTIISTKNQFQTFSQLSQDDISNNDNSDSEQLDNININYSKPKPKRKSKKSKKSKTPPKVSTLEDIDLMLQSFQSSSIDNQHPIPSFLPCITEPPKKHLLSIDHKMLDSDLEMRKMFGSVVINSEPRKRNNLKYSKKTLFSNPKDTWPRITKLGLDMEIIQKPNIEKKGLVYFSFTHSKFYSDIQIQFLQAINTHNPDAITQLLQMFPYHIDSLLQLSEICKSNGDHTMCAELLDRALYSFERSFHPLLNFNTGKSRLDFDRVENRSFFLALYRYSQVVVRKGCWRTALEFSKLLLGLDFESDPYGVLNTIDFYALKAQEYSWILNFWAKYKDEKKLHLMPNFMYSISLATFELEILDKKDHTQSSKLLIDAILAYPSAIPALYELAAINDPMVSTLSFFRPNVSDSLLEILVSIFIDKNSEIWKMSDSLKWLRQQVDVVVEMISAKDIIVHRGLELRKTLIETSVPRNILRYIYAADIPSLRGKIYAFTQQTQILAYDPLPPDTATSSVYDKFNESQRALNPLTNASFLTGLLQSLLPWTDTQGLPDVAIQNRQLDQRQIDQAIAEAENALPGLFPGRAEEGRDWIQTLREALLGTHREEIENDSDDDDEYESANE